MPRATDTANRRSRWDSVVAPARFLFLNHAGRNKTVVLPTPVRRFHSYRAKMWDAAICRPIAEISLQLFQNPMKRDADPIRPVRKFVLNLHQSLFKSIGIQQSLNFRLSLRQPAGSPGSFKVSSQE